MSALDALLAFRFYFGTAPVFAFSVVIYAAQTLSSLYIFRRLGTLSAIGHAALLGFASYSGYELAFKLSFLVFGNDRVNYFVSYDLYPAAVFAFALFSLLAVRDRINTCALSLALGACAGVWVAWLLSGNFPLDMQAYELEPGGPTVVFNFLTKLLFSLAFVIGSATGFGYGWQHHVVLLDRHPHAFCADLQNCPKLRVVFTYCEVRKQNEAYRSSPSSHDSRVGPLICILKKA